MRWPLLIIALFITVSINQAPARTGTAEGVAALARGDYQQAAEILKPIAEGWRTPDPMAQFFMATLYETGRGVPQDVLRACALYQRASGALDHPFGAQAGKLFKTLMRAHDAEWIQDCQLLAEIGFDHRFEPVTLTLTPGHSVAWDLKGATVTYERQARRFDMRLASRGSLFLPIRHTELRGSAPESSARHFNEVFLWQPSADGRAWSLAWHLFEIVRDEVIRVDAISQPVVTIQAAEPPAARSFDVRAYVDLRLTTNGDAEWALLQGPGAGTGLIESDAERREVRARDLARSAAAKRVDWKKERDAYRSPSMAYADADGCGGIFVYGWSDDRTEMITVRADKQLLGLSTAPASFDLARQTSTIEAIIHVYALPRRDGQFCSDAGSPVPAGPGGLDEQWRAVAGTITIELSPPGVRARSPRLYRAAVRLTNAEFVNRAGVRVRQPQPITLSAIVGGW